MFSQALMREVAGLSVEVDVAVVGGGPSGAATAHYLATRGHEVLVVEKKNFPREKTCGDGLTPRAVKVLEEMGLGDELKTWESVQGLRIHGAGRSMELPFPELTDWPSYGLVKPRKDLDRLVLAKAEEFGAKVLFGTQATEPIFEGGILRGFRAQRNRDKEEVHSRYVNATSLSRWGSPNGSTSALRCTTADGSRRISTWSPKTTRCPVTGGSSR
jgi:flavin-dependent dehydrogenase